MYQGCNSRGVFSKLSKWTSTDLEVLVHFHIVERGKLESLESLENIPNFSNFFRGLKRPLVHNKNRRHGRRGKGMAESFSREKLRHAPQKEGG